MTHKLKTLNKKNKTALVVTALFAVIGAGILIFANAATPPQTGTVTTLAGGNVGFSLSPASGTFGASTNVAGTINVNAGTSEISTVDVKLSYDTAKLDFVSIDGSGGAFSTCTENSGGGGTASLVCTKLGGSVNGTQKVGNVTFKTKTVAGAASVSFAGSSHVWSYAASPADLWNGVATAATYTVSIPSSGGGGGGGTGGSGGTPTTPTTTTTPKTTTGGSSTPTTTAPTATGTENVTTTTSGGQVIVKLVDDKGAPITGISVSLGTLSAITDSYGLANFSGVVAGTYTVSAKTDKGQAKVKIQVKADSPTTAQQFQLQVKPKSMIILYVVIAVGVIAAVVAGGVAFVRQQRKSKFNRSHGLGNSAVIFDANSSAPSPVEQAPIIAPQPPATKGPEGSIITPSAEAPKSDDTPS